MAKVEITINGKAYPCRMTMGAMLRFKNETGKEVLQVEEWGFSDLCTLLWCCIVSACKADGVEFSLSLMEFADGLAPDEVTQWADTILRENGSDQQEKKADTEKKT